MRLCPACGNQYSDDANFCPMDATRLPPPAAAPAAAPQAPRGPLSAAPEAPTVLASTSGASAIAGRFLTAGAGIETPTGTLFDARDTQSGGAEVALKLVGPAVLPNASMADRALRELKQLAKVSSERILRVIDQGRTSDGQLYVATQPPEGVPLDELVRRDGPLPLERACAIVLQVGEALTEAQKVGVIHRDVSPRNVLVGAGDQVKVTEFGLAQPISDKVFGAPAYLSPEQVEGRPVDQRSNIYSLAAIFYHALTGAPPFSGDAQALLSQQANATPAPPSSKRPGLSAEIDRVILKALEKSGGRRHLTLRQFLAEVESARAPKTATASSLPATTTPSLPIATTPSMPATTIPTMPAAPHTTPSMTASPHTTPSMTASRSATSATVMGIPSPAARPQTTPSLLVPQAPASAPPAAPSGHAPPEARTVMAEAPAVPPSEVRTVMAEAPAVPPARNLPASAPPVVQAAVAAAQARVQAAQPAASGQGGFRETAWFKVGEIEEERAKMEAAAAQRSGGDVLAPTGTTGKNDALDPDAIDLSAADKARLSLKTGATQRMAAITGPTALGADRMDESEMLAEIDSSRKWLLLAGAIAAAVVIAVILFFVLHSSSSSNEPAPAKPAPVAAAPQAPAPAPVAPPPAAAPAPAPAVPAPATKPAAAPPAADSPAELLAQAHAQAAKGNLAASVDALTRAVAAGASAREVKGLETSLGRAVGKRLAVARRHHDRAGEAEAKALAARLRSLKTARR